MPKPARLPGRLVEERGWVPGGRLEGRGRPGLGLQALGTPHAQGAHGLASLCSHPVHAVMRPALSPRQYPCQRGRCRRPGVPGPTPAAFPPPPLCRCPPTPTCWTASASEAGPESALALCTRSLSRRRSSGRRIWQPSRDVPAPLWGLRAASWLSLRLFLARLEGPACFCKHTSAFGFSLSFSVSVVPGL